MLRKQNSWVARREGAGRGLATVKMILRINFKTQAASPNLLERVVLLVGSLQRLPRSRDIVPQSCIPHFLKGFEAMGLKFGKSQ